MKAFGMAMYGVEVAQPAKYVLAKFVSAATDFLYPCASWCRTTTLAMVLVGGGSSLWPDTRILVLRVLALRRAVAKDPKAADDLMRVLARRVAEGGNGTRVQ